MASKTYTRTARILHWTMALAIIPLLIFGQQTMGNHQLHLLPTIHTSAGFVILVLLVVRLWWRWRNPSPETLVKSGWEKTASKLAHGLLYAAMLFIPLTGWLAYTEHVRRSLGVRPASLFGFKIPLLPDFGINWHFIHNWGGKITLALIAVHIAAALKHHFYNRDNTLRRMLP
jgi:cytochrome b561